MNLFKFKVCEIKLLKIDSNYNLNVDFIEMLEFDDNTSEEEFIAEVSLWVKEHNAINKYKDYKGEEWAWVKEPKRNVKMHFVNKAGEDIYAILENCKIMDIVDDNSMIVFIEKLRLIDNI